ncbi:hypothetical protein VCHA53O466_50093 [Vibrio chagasii]|nr:hypothetical protein VCHA53O466_50093 [Vibrio chagasii]
MLTNSVSNSFFDYIPKPKHELFKRYLREILKKSPSIKIIGVYGEYKGNRSNLVVECPVHGRQDEWRNPHHPIVSSLLLGRKCAKCAGNYRKVQGDFLEGARKVHGDTYDYTPTVYVRDAEKVKIICRVHGEFEQSASSHLQGMGCKKCGHYGNSCEPKSKKDFIRDAQEKYGTWFDYSLVQYRGNKEPVHIVCPIHGTFEKSPNAFMRQKTGCTKCSQMKGSHAGLKEFNELYSFISEAKKVHLDKYSYIGARYKDDFTPIRVRCREHDEFWVKPRAHLKGEGCKLCKYK